MPSSSSRSSKAVMPVPSIESPSNHELKHVHAVYDSIAPHFSSTRYKPWPIIAKFLNSIPTGWVGLDAGTGNGKYLPLPHSPSSPASPPSPSALDDPSSNRTHNVDGGRRNWTIGLDRSRNLLEIAKYAGSNLGPGDGEDVKKCLKGNVVREVLQADVLQDCWREGVFDYAISIATIHHLSTPTRRKRAVQSLLNALSRTHGRALIYVWATQQDQLSKRAIPMTSTTVEDGQKVKGADVFVPWVLQESTSRSSKKDDAKTKKKPSNKGRQCEEPSEGSTTNGDTLQAPSTSTAPSGAAEDANPTGPNAPTPTYNRYYHMFEEGELKELVSEAAEELGFVLGEATDAPQGDSGGAKPKHGVEVVEDGWERSNFYVELRLWTRV